MPSFNIVRDSNAQFSPNFLPVAVFLGGTGGIGLGMARALARATNGNCHIILLGRNQGAAESAFSTFPKPTALGAKHEFIHCDATLMKNVSVAAKDVLARTNGKINYIVLSCAFLDKLSAEYTEEGIEKKLALIFYARWKFVLGLMNPLEEAVKLGEDAVVYNVGGGIRVGSKLDISDMGLKKNFGVLTTMRGQMPTYHNLVMEHLASEHSTISFYNAHPGTVNSAILSNLQEPLVFKLFLNVMNCLAPLFAVSSDTSGEHMLHAMLGNQKGGLHYIEPKGDEVPPRLKYNQEERDIMWSHLLGAIGEDTRNYTL